MIQDAVGKIDAAAEQAARETAERGAARAEAAGMSASAVAVRGAPAFWPCLLKAADEHDAAAVVAGSRGRSKLESALLGSVSNGLVQHSARPVLVVRDAAGR